jgi:SAM-dependent methyltransferase
MILECQKCELTFTQDCPDEDEIGKYYQSEEYISHSNTSRGIINRIYHFVRKLMLQRKYRMIVSATNKSTGTLIDIGCGTGHFLDQMKKKKWEVKGIEVNDKARKFATDTFGLEIFTPAYLETIKDTSVDCITMWHVLEHFHDPNFYLESARRILNDDGTIIIALPNNNSFDARYYKNFWAAWDVPRHLWHFNPSTFDSYINDFGFKVKRIHRLPFDSFYVSMLSERYKGRKLASVKGLIIGTISWLISLMRIRRTCSIV